jgi:hypothetical protein
MHLPSSKRFHRPMSLHHDGSSILDQVFPPLIVYNIAIFFHYYKSLCSNTLTYCVHLSTTTTTPTHHPSPKESITLQPMQKNKKQTATNAIIVVSLKSHNSMMQCVLCFVVSICHSLPYNSTDHGAGWWYRRLRQRRSMQHRHDTPRNRHTTMRPPRNSETVGSIGRRRNTDSPVPAYPRWSQI